VRTINIPKKRMVKGRTEGFRPGYKKAVVKLKEGDKIEIGGQ
jgi:ribosomal protein L23